MQSEFFLFEVIIVLLAGFFHGVVGFGFPMIATPLFVLFLDLSILQRDINKAKDFIKQT